MSPRRRIVAVIVAPLVLVAVLVAVTQSRTISGGDQREARAAAIRLVEADTAIGRLPGELPQRRQQVATQSDVRRQALEQVWDDHQVEAKAREWEDALRLVADDADYRAYSEERLTVTDWQGTHRGRNGTMVTFLGHMDYLGPSWAGWSESPLDRYQVTIRKTASGWRLVGIDVHQLVGS